MHIFVILVRSKLKYISLFALGVEFGLGSENMKILLLKRRQNVSIGEYEVSRTDDSL